MVIQYLGSFVRGRTRARRLVEVGAAGNLVLDGLPTPTIAYGDIRLRTAYTGSLRRIRNTVSLAEANYGYTGSNIIDSAAILSALGADPGSVVTWFNQGSLGATGDATQASGPLQPSYVSGGALVATVGTNAIPAMVGSGAGALRLETGTINRTDLIGAGHVATMIAVMRANTGSAVFRALVSGTQFYSLSDTWTTNEILYDTGDAASGGRYNSGGGADGTVTADRIRLTQINGTAAFARRNRVTTIPTITFSNSTLPATGTLQVGGVGGTSGTQTLSCLMFWPSVLSPTDYQAIEDRLAVVYGGL